MDIDLKQAAKWYRMGADAGSDRCQYNLGVLLEKGALSESKENQKEEAMNYYKQAAALGHIKANLVSSLVKFKSLDFLLT